jgi:hypothetical protein
MEIPKSWQLDWEIAKNTVGGIADRTNKALVGLSDPAQKSTPNAFGRGGVTTDPLQQGLRAVAAPPTDAPPPQVSVPVALQPAGLKTPVTAAQPAAAPAAETPIPIGKYGWKGASEALRPGQPTLVFGTPGQDGGGVGSWRPGSARVAGSPTTSARFTSFDQPTGNMIQARSPQYDFGNSSTQTQTPIDFARMSRAERRFALTNAKLDQGQQALTTEAGKAQDVYDLGLRRLANDQDQIGVQRDANAGMSGLRAAQTTEAESKALAGQRIASASDALTRATPGSDAEKIALRNLLVQTGQGSALARDPKQNIEKIAEKDAFGNTIREKLVRINPDGTSTDVIDKTPGAGLDAAFDTMIAADPKLSAKFNALTPEQQAAQRKLYRDSQTKGM